MGYASALEVNAAASASRPRIMALTAAAGNAEGIGWHAGQERAESGAGE